MILGMDKKKTTTTKTKQKKKTKKKKTKRGDKLLGLIGVLSGTSMLHEGHSQSHTKLEPTLLQVRVSN